jgi:hypothetical protein
MHPHTNEGLEGASGTHPFLDKALHHRRPVTTTATETPSFRKMRPAMKYRTCPRRGQSRIRKGNHKLHRIEERFTKLSHFVCIALDCNKCSLFEEGLIAVGHHVQSKITAVGYSYFSQLVEAAGSARLGGWIAGETSWSGGSCFCYDPVGGSCRIKCHLRYCEDP